MGGGTTMRNLYHLSQYPQKHLKQPYTFSEGMSIFRELEHGTIGVGEMSAIARGGHRTLLI